MKSKPRTTQQVFECIHCHDVFWSQRYKRTECKCGKSWAEQPKGQAPKANASAAIHPIKGYQA